MSNHPESPCLTCGACCAAFRVSFYWGECQSAGGRVPDELTLQITPHHACMKGTEKSPVHCVALVGTPGERVSCSIYENRSSTCREFDIWNEDGSVNEACTRAREIYGLPPLPILATETLASSIADTAPPTPGTTHP